MLGGWVVRPIDQATQRIILKIVWFFMCSSKTLQSHSKRSFPETLLPKERPLKKPFRAWICRFFSKEYISEASLTVSTVSRYFIVSSRIMNYNALATHCKPGTPLIMGHYCNTTFCLHNFFVSRRNTIENIRWPGVWFLSIVDNIRLELLPTRYLWKPQERYKIRWKGFTWHAWPKPFHPASPLLL